MRISNSCRSKCVLFICMKHLRDIFLSTLTFLFLTDVGSAQPVPETWNDLPIRALLLSAPDSTDVSLFCKFIRDALPREGVNTLVVRFGYRYQFESHPELAAPGALTKAE